MSKATTAKRATRLSSRASALAKPPKKAAAVKKAPATKPSSKSKPIKKLDKKTGKKV
jgi:hypothetical protein